MSGTGFVAPADLPLSDEEDVEQAVFACLFACLFAWLPVSHSRDVAILKFLIVLDSGCAHALLGCPGTKCSCSSLISETCWLWPGDGGLFNYIQLFVGFSWFFFKIRCLISASDVTPEFYICACME